MSPIWTKIVTSASFVALAGCERDHTSRYDRGVSLRHSKRRE